MKPPHLALLKRVRDYITLGLYRYLQGVLLNTTYRGDLPVQPHKFTHFREQQYACVFSIVLFGPIGPCFPALTDC